MAKGRQSLVGLSFLTKPYKSLGRRRRSQRGFSITEVIVAAILTILIAQATTAALVVNARTQGTSVEESQFLRIVNQDVERVRDVASALCRSSTSPLSYNGCNPPTNPSLKQRCDSTSSNAGLAQLLSSSLPAFSDNIFTSKNRSTVTITRTSSIPTVPGASSFSVLRLAYTSSGLSPNLSYVTEVVPDVVGWCSTAI
ncbi:hypothetical protein Synpcc7942_2482 [Synechococcus elongatus PCC 7942 = FACHB-805]|uniref:Uncharacterized protein n=1 Tax=Synechococcus elongatus (strain ATCC 33912 / PCC 7942 / FACHB-805) TaxID=1140 RepID=Q8GIS8_SYNE7|nr:unknown [Synechococcus elongatus PCC 7942 = FACHB-805]ABB58512.1 hypothetical protein Synpcc7942_2482 [Synechococcus elongatus PCC 7942 = FACHB-805]